MITAIYPGSFNPFHKGHLNILQKAEAIFEKVIVARGNNESKDFSKLPMPEFITNTRVVMNYSGLLTDFIKTLEGEVVVIRGLRNSTDLQYELTQYRYLQDIMPDIRVISIFCDKEFEHISSSAIRMLEKYGQAEKYLV